MLGIKRFAFSAVICIVFFNKKFRGYRCRAKFIIKFTALLLKIKFHTKKTRRTKCFAILIGCFNMPANRTFPFINAKNGLEDCVLLAYRLFMYLYAGLVTALSPSN